MNKELFNLFLNEGVEELDEALPKDAADAYAASGINKEVRSRSDSPDYAAAQYTELTPGEALELLKTDPTSVRAIVKDRRGIPRMVKFGADGRTDISKYGPGNFRFDVPNELAYVNKRGSKKGELRTDIHYMPNDHIVSIADKLYRAVEPARDPNQYDTRAQNFESPKYKSRLKRNIMSGSDISFIDDAENKIKKYLSSYGSVEALNKHINDNINISDYAHYLEPQSNGIIKIDTSYGGTGDLKYWLEKFLRFFNNWGYNDGDTERAWAAYITLLEGTLRNPTYNDFIDAIKKAKELYNDKDLKARLRYGEVETVLKDAIDAARNKLSSLGSLESQLQREQEKKTTFQSPEQRSYREGEVKRYIDYYKRELLSKLAQLEAYETQLDNIDASDAEQIKRYDDEIARLGNEIASVKNMFGAKGAVYGNTPFGNPVPESLQESSVEAEVDKFVNDKEEQWWTNPKFDVKKYGKYFDSNHQLIPELKNEYLDAISKAQAEEARDEEPIDEGLSDLEKLDRFLGIDESLTEDYGEDIIDRFYSEFNPSGDHEGGFVAYDYNELNRWTDWLDEQGADYEVDHIEDPDDMFYHEAVAYLTINESLTGAQKTKHYRCSNCGYEADLTDDEYDGSCPKCHEHHGEFVECDESLTEAVNPDNDRAVSLAEYLGIDLSEIDEISENDFETPDGEYLVLTEDEAYNRAVDEVKMSFDDMGLEAFSPKFRDWILNNAIDGASVDDFIDQEIDYYEQQEEDEDTLNTLRGLDSKADKLEYIEDVYGNLNDWVKKENIDLDAVAEEAISEDGVAHFISYYDGKEIELPNNLFAYRIN